MKMEGNHIIGLFPHNCNFTNIVFPRYDINNAFMERYLPLSDDVHGPYKMMPPELLHTSGSGLIMYMFESLRTQLGKGKDRDEIDDRPSTHRHIQSNK